MQLKAAYKNNNDWVDVTIAEIEGFKDIEKNKFSFIVNSVSFHKFGEVN